MNAPGRNTKYSQMADALRQQIKRGDLQPGDRLPSINELRVQHGTSVSTVDRVLGILENDGLLVRVNGSGIYVARPDDTVSGEDPAKPLLGLVLPNCQGSFFSPIIRAVEEESRAAGYNLIVANSFGDHDLEARLLRQLAGQTKGLCVMACSTGNQSAFATLLERRTPFVLLDRRVEGLDVHLVATDNERGGYLATKHLFETGCRRVYAIGESSEQLSSLRERLQGFRKGLSEAGVPFDASLIRQTKDAPARLGYQLTKELLTQLGPEVRGGGRIGLFALNEMTARGVYLALEEARLSIPDDVAVVGFDDAIADLFNPPLTSVRQDLTGMGSEAVRRLIELIRLGGAIKARQTRLQPDLIVRNSSDAHSVFCRINQMLQDHQHIEPGRGPFITAATL